MQKKGSAVSTAVLQRHHQYKTLTKNICTDPILSPMYQIRCHQTQLHEQVVRGCIVVRPATSTHTKNGTQLYDLYMRVCLLDSITRYCPSLDPYSAARCLRFFARHGRDFSWFSSFNVANILSHIPHSCVTFSLCPFSK